MFFNAQSTVAVISGVPDISQSLFREVLEKMQYNESGAHAHTSRLEALAVGTACYARGYILLQA